MSASDVEWLGAIAKISGAAAVLLDSEGVPAAADRAALALLGCDSIEALRAIWPQEARNPSEEIALSASNAADLRVRVVALGADSGRCRVALVRKQSGDGAQAREQGADTFSFARKLGHDLRGPLNAMVLNLDLLRTYLDLDVDEEERNAKLRRYMAALHREIGRLNELLTAALERART